MAYQVIISHSLAFSPATLYINTYIFIYKQQKASDPKKGRRTGKRKERQQERRPRSLQRGDQSCMPQRRQANRMPRACDLISLGLGEGEEEVVWRGETGVHALARSSASLSVSCMHSVCLSVTSL